MCCRWYGYCYGYRASIIKDFIMVFIYNKDDNNIVTLTMDTANKSVNLINEDFYKSLLENVMKLEKESNLKGVILASAKKTFLAGADLDMLYNINAAKTCYDIVESGKAVMRRFELIGKPIVAVMNGTALGGGMELALCCHYRIAVNNSKSKFGFPEVNLGILPGGGGVARLPRLIGLESSLPLLLEGRKLNAVQAQSKGLINELASNEEEMLSKAISWIDSNPNYEQPWDQKSFKFPGGNAHHPKNAQMIAVAPAVLRKKTRGNFPAPEAILSAVIEGSLVDFETASRIESRFFVQLSNGKVSKNIMNATWFQMNALNSEVSRPKDISLTSTSKVGVLGSGLMGHGIAYASAMAGIEVVMTDVNQESANNGLKRIRNILESAQKRGLIDQEKMDAALQRITPTDDNKLLKGCDLIIEAVFEDRDLKAKVTAKAEKHLVENGVFASNTSSIPITSLAEQSASPEKFIGIHFFSPVHKMKLVEIIKGKMTSPQTLAKAFDYVLKIKKIPIVVNDSRGFYTSRVFERYTGEGMTLLTEGNSAKNIESAGKQAGFPVGPLAVIDEISIGLAAHIRDQSWKDLKAAGKEIEVGPWDGVIDFMTKEVNRTGRAGHGGFYEYPNNEEKYLWPELEKHFPLSENPLSQQEMIDRFHFIQAIETVRCYEEGVLTSVADANIGSIFGWGFPLFKGGTLQFINDYGLKQFRVRARDLSKQYGKRFSPPKLIDQMIEKGQTF